ncbi:hypothetical protein M5D96_005214 [Drosophila gunungcola]|uniref:Uncharacterized protein n=1 Tax=Drosophila gunungcola TaxID=103775 RepID=A0A9P9YQC6_9MUSC|nr:hypothetical protein M5D96_005214 [Drosophila gunungcola]
MFEKHKPGGQTQTSDGSGRGSIGSSIAIKQKPNELVVETKPQRPETDGFFNQMASKIGQEEQQVNPTNLVRSAFCILDKHFWLPIATNCPSVPMSNCPTVQVSNPVASGFINLSRRAAVNLLRQINSSASHANNQYLLSDY